MGPKRNVDYTVCVRCVGERNIAALEVIFGRAASKVLVCSR